MLLLSVVTSSGVGVSSPATEVPDVEQTLGRVESLFGARRAADTELFVLAAHYADLHPAE